MVNQTKCKPGGHILTAAMTYEYHEADRQHETRFCCRCCWFLKRVCCCGRSRVLVSLQCSVERFKGHFVNYGSLTHSRMRSRGASATVRSQHGVIENGRDFNALPVARGKVTGRCPQITCFVEGKYIRSVAAKRPLTSLTPLPLDQTGSRSQWQTLNILSVHFSWES